MRNRDDGKMMAHMRPGEPNRSFLLMRLVKGLFSPSLWSGGCCPLTAMKRAYPGGSLGLLVLSNCSTVDGRVPMDSALTPMRIHKIDGCRRESKQTVFGLGPF